MSLQSNDVSHWLGANLESALITWHENTFRTTGPLQGESTGDHRILLTGPEMWSFEGFLLSAWTSCWTNSHVSGDLRCHDAHVMSLYCDVRMCQNRTLGNMTLSNMTLGNQALTKWWFTSKHIVKDDLSKVHEFWAQYHMNMRTEFLVLH